MHKSIIAVFTLWVALVMTTGCACSPKLTYNSPKALKNITSSVVKISVDYTVQDKITLAVIQKAYFATGFSFKTTDVVSFVLTNKHVCDMGPNANYTLTLQSGGKVSATFVRSDAFADVCVLKANGIIPPLTLAKDNASQGDRVVTIGGPDGAFPLLVDGLISGYYNMHMRNDADEDGDFEVHFRAQVMSAPVYPGSSGSPMLNVDGEVIGIVFAVRGDKEHISFIVPISEVWRFLDTSEYVHMN